MRSEIDSIQRATWNNEYMDIKTFIGQKCIIGFQGKNAKTLEKLYAVYPFGGVILFERNYESKKQLKELIKEIKNLTQDVPLFISVDQEGGTVQRFKKDFTAIASPKTIGEIYTKEGKKTAQKIFETLAEELIEVGINLNFAPLYDINTNPENPIIGKRGRAFSHDPFIVADVGNLEAEIFLKKNLIACAKHFPGHGDTHKDSHVMLPEVTQTLSELRERELIPFSEAIKNNIPMIMTAHVLYSTIDKHYPATVSEVIIKNILRKELKFKGVVITDALEMKGISEGYSSEKIVERGLAADTDIFLFGETKDSYQRTFEKLMQIYEQDQKLKRAIENSVMRILRLKEDYL